MLLSGSNSARIRMAAGVNMKARFSGYCRVLLALIQTGNQGPETAKAVQWLLAVQNADGGWPITARNAQQQHNRHEPCGARPGPGRLYAGAGTGDIV